MRRAWTTTVITIAVLLITTVAAATVGTKNAAEPGALTPQDVAGETEASSTTVERVQEAASTPATTPASTTGLPPPGEPTTPEEWQAIAALFDDQPLAGGQAQPRVTKSVTEETFLFLQFDHSDPAQVTALNYVGLGLSGRFCEEVWPDSDLGSFSHFHRWLSPLYGLGHGTVPAAEGYWLSFMLTNVEDVGVGYGLFATPPPHCADLSSSLPAVKPPLEPVTSDEAAAIEALFDDAPFTGGQVAPYVAKWISADVFLFLEPSADGAWAYAGLGVRGTFCASSQPTGDFTHFQRYEAPTWTDGAGGTPGGAGYWLAHLGTGAGSATIGIDRGFDLTPPPSCG